MTRLRFQVSLLVLGLAAGAWAGPSVAEAERAAASAREGVTSVRARQQAVRGELSQVARRIEAAKSGGSGVLPRAELDGLLQRSQELSNELTQLAQRLSAEEVKTLAADQVLLDALASQLAALRVKALEAPRSERPALVAQLKRLREQQSRVLARLPAASVPALPTRASDDPEELLEQADALRDGEDKLRARMELVRQRLAQAQAAAELDRRMGDFSRDDALFDDSDRRFRLRREVASDSASDRGQPSSGAAAEFQSTASAPSAPSDAAPMGSGSAPSPSNSIPQGGTTVVSAKDSLPQVGRSMGGVPAVSEDDVGVLEAELKQLQRQVVDLSSRASALEKKAQSLGER